MNAPGTPQGAQRAEHTVVVTGGAGYIGSRLVPALLGAGWRVVVLDALWFGSMGLRRVAADERLVVVPADIRDEAAVRRVLQRHRPDAVVHLAAISNDPSSELDPDVTRAVNLRAVRALISAAEDAGVRRFVYASSASVYGIKSEPDVTEDLPLEPITLYAECKARGEDLLFASGLEGVAVRAATVCGWSPRLRLDLTVNILTSHALQRGVIRVFGGEQLRPNVHIDDLVEFYLLLLDAPAADVAGRAFNVVAHNASVRELAETIRERVGTAWSRAEEGRSEGTVSIEVVPTVDHRSYHLSGERAARVLGWRPRRRVVDAIDDLVAAWRTGRIPAPDSAIYRNVQWMRANPALWRLEAGEG